MDGRLRKLESDAQPTRPARTFRMIAENYLDPEPEITRFKAANGVTDDDLLIVRVIFRPRIGSINDGTVRSLNCGEWRRRRRQDEET